MLRAHRVDATFIGARGLAAYDRSGSFKELNVNPLALALALAVFSIAACSSTDDGDEQSTANAIRMPSGLASERPLSDLTDPELMQFCSAASATLYSATTVARECELEAIVNESLLGGDVSCQDAADACVQGFLETAEFKCVSQIAEATNCTATVGDGEECSFATANLRAMLFPRVSCSSDADAKAAAIQDVYAANVFDSAPACQRYATCRRTL
jgi:hypothetical protein